MTKGSIGIAIVVIILVVIVLSFAMSAVGVWNKLNREYQAVEGGKSHYSAALNTCTEKIKGVWEIANQYMKHESETFIAVAQARSGFLFSPPVLIVSFQIGKVLVFLSILIVLDMGRKMPVS